MYYRRCGLVHLFGLAMVTNIKKLEFTREYFNQFRCIRLWSELLYMNNLTFFSIQYECQVDQATNK